MHGRAVGEGEWWITCKLLRHFDLAAKEIGLAGRWVAANPGLETGNAEYIVTWVES